MPKSDLQLNGGPYAPVADRVALFYGTFPDGRIITDRVSETPPRWLRRWLEQRDAREDQERGGLSRDHSLSPSGAEPS